MGQRAEELKQEIQGTRAELSGTLDAIGDRVSPGRMVDRRRTRMRLGMERFREQLMGTAQGVREQITSSVLAVAVGGSDRLSSAADTVNAAPDSLRARTQGSPLVVGLLAFGGGVLVASLLPVSEKEKEAGSQLADRAQPIKDELTNAAQEVVENLKEPARTAIEEVKDTAQEGAHEVADQAQEAASSVKDTAQDAAADQGPAESPGQRS